MKPAKPIQDIIDVHVTSNETSVDCFSQYPLLQGELKYTVQVTEFCCPLTSSALPHMSFFEDDGNNTREYFFELRRKRTTDLNINRAHDDSSLSTLNVSDVGGAATLFPNDSYYKFRKAPQRKLTTVGEFVYSLDRFFNDFIQKYRQDQVDDTLLGDSHGGTDKEIQEDELFVTVRLSPGGTLSLVFNKLFTMYNVMFCIFRLLVIL